MPMMLRPRPTFINNAWLGENRSWQYWASLALVMLGYIIGQMPFAMELTAQGMALGMDKAEIDAKVASGQLDAFGISRNRMLFLILLSFVFALLGLWTGLRYFHRRPLRSLLRLGGSPLRYGRVALGFGIWLGLNLVAEGISYALEPDNYIWQFDPARFGLLLLIGLTLLPLQTSFEELLMRGYLMQGIGTGLRSRWAALLLSSLIFGLLHSFNPEVQAYGFWLLMPSYVLTGLLLGLVTLLDEGLELALGIHFANNLYASLVVTFPASALPTDALFAIRTLHPEYATPGILLFGALSLLILARLCGWQDWRDKLRGPLYELAESETGEDGYAEG